MTTFSRDDLERYLRLLIEKLQQIGAPAEVRVVGGAALALRYFERATTTDIDVMIVGDGKKLDAAIKQVADENGLPSSWLNEEARKYIPFWGKPVEWQTIYDVNGVVVQIASAEALLAMKLRANRPGRDDKDVARLIAICGIATLDQAEKLFESYYPGDGLSDRAARMVDRSLQSVSPDMKLPPEIRLTDR